MHPGAPVGRNSGEPGLLRGVWRGLLALFLLCMPVGCGGSHRNGAPETVAGGAAGPSDGEGAGPIVVADFGPEDEGKSVPSGWRELTFDPDDFPKKSEYRVVKLDGKHVLRARTDSGASGLYKPVSVKPQDYPYVAWRWRVDQVFDKADGRTKQGDDYPARLYVAFKYDPSSVGLLTQAAFEVAKSRSEEGRYPPLHALNYVWANRLSENTWIPNPYQDRSKMIAVESGREGLGRWQWEVRNYLRDFRATVGGDPTPVEFIAVMIDGDGTASSGVSYFGRIELWSKAPPYETPGPLAPPTRLGEWP